MSTKQVLQLDDNGVFVGVTVADKSPLEKDVWLFPRNTIDHPVPDVPQGYIAVWNGSSFTYKKIEDKPYVTDPVPPAEVKSVTMRQARLALLQVGKLSEVETAIENLEEPSRTMAKIEWEYSQEVHRDKDLVKFLAPSLGLSEEDLNQLFTLAATK